MSGWMCGDWCVGADGRAGVVVVVVVVVWCFHKTEMNMFSPSHVNTFHAPFLIYFSSPCSHFARSKTKKKPYPKFCIGLGQGRPNESPHDWMIEVQCTAPIIIAYRVISGHAWAAILMPITCVLELCV